ncbi:MAG: hypothetical protein IPI60_13725 [Saprospiraceae bacterium]|nr:hypothetical protein [Saprospiraceae bacterium]
MTQFQNIADKLVHPCCGGTHEFMKPLLDHLDDIQYTVNTFYNKPGFNQLVEALSHSLFTVQDGTSHVYLSGGI